MNAIQGLRPEKLRELVLLILIALVLIVFSSVIENYLNARLFNRVSASVALMAVLAIGQTMVVLTRNIDLSVGLHQLGGARCCDRRCQGQMAAAYCNAVRFDCPANDLGGG